MWVVFCLLAPVCSVQFWNALVNDRNIILNFSLVVSGTSTALCWLAVAAGAANAARTFVLAAICSQAVTLVGVLNALILAARMRHPEPSYAGWNILVGVWALSLLLYTFDQFVLVRTGNESK